MQFLNIESSKKNRILYRIKSKVCIVFTLSNLSVKISDRTNLKFGILGPWLFKKVARSGIANNQHHGVSTMEFNTDFGKRCVMAELKYNMSFTAGGLFLLETIPIAKMYLATKDWEKTKETTLVDNTIQSKTNSSLERINREIISRIQLLTDDQITLLVEGNTLEKKLTLWVAICRKHKFINDFAVEVIREKFLQLNFRISTKDFDVFFNRKAEWHDELGQLTESSRTKLRQVLFKMLKEAGILLPNDEINKIYFTSKFIETMKRMSRTEFSIFPISDLEISTALGV